MHLWNYASDLIDRALTIYQSNVQLGSQSLHEKLYTKGNCRHIFSIEPISKTGYWQGICMLADLFHFVISWRRRKDAKLHLFVFSTSQRNNEQTQICHRCFHLHGLTRAARIMKQELQNKQSCQQWDSNYLRSRHATNCATRFDIHNPLIFNCILLVLFSCTTW